MEVYDIVNPLPFDSELVSLKLRYVKSGAVSGCVKEMTNRDPSLI